MFVNNEWRLGLSNYWQIGRDSVVAKKAIIFSCLIQWMPNWQDRYWTVLLKVGCWLSFSAPISVMVKGYGHCYNQTKINVVSEFESSKCHGGGTTKDGFRSGHCQLIFKFVWYGRSIFFAILKSAMHEEIWGRLEPFLGVGLGLLAGTFKLITDFVYV